MGNKFFGIPLRSGISVGLSAGIGKAGVVGPPPPLVTSFYAPLRSTLTPTTALGSPTPTFTRSTTAYAAGYVAGANPGALQSLLACAINEARFSGARRVSPGVWSSSYADASPIPAANLLGVLMEKAATNFVLQSQDFTTASWVKVNVPTTVNEGIFAAPDGTMTATTLTAGGINGTIRQALTLGVAVGVFSVYLSRKFGGGNIQITVNGSTFTTIQPGNIGEWTRVSLDFTGTTPTVGIRVVTGNDSVYVWGAQVENTPGFEPSSYIPTTVASASRGADSLAYAVAGNFSNTAGTVVAEVLVRDVNPCTPFGNPVGAGKVLDVALDGTVSANSGSGGTPTDGTIFTNVESAIASAWNSVNGQAAANAVVGAQVAMGAYVLGTNFTIANSLPSGASFVNVRELSIYTTGIFDAALAALVPTPLVIFNPIS